MRLAVLAAADPLKVSTWSGTPYYMTKALRSKFSDLFTVSTPRPEWLQYVRRVICKVTAGKIDVFWSPSLAAWNASQLARRLEIEQVDAALCIGNASISAYIAQRLPTIHVSDATVPLMREYYSEFSRLPEFLAASALRLDSESVCHSRACLYSTEWAANSAIRDYGADPRRIHVIPWGANIDVIEHFDHEAAINRDICNLVFIGIDWQRKGGAIAVATAMRLLEIGYPVRLHIIGAMPALGTKMKTNAIVMHGFISKGTREGRDRFNSIMKQAAFLFVPTRQDCSPMVFPEANSYGVPVITTRTGGVPGVVLDGVNGHMLPIDATPEEYANLIGTIWSDPELYGRLRASSRRHFSNTLNWDSWVARAAAIIERAAWEGR